MRHRFAAVIAALTLTAAAVTTAAQPADAVVCANTWGSLTKASVRTGTGSVTTVRSGQHACFDRLVIDVSGRATGHYVSYVPVVEGSSGAGFPVSGGADLLVVVRAPASDGRGRATFVPRDRTRVVDVSGYRTLRQVRFVESFEGETVFAVGVRARLPMRVTVLNGPGTGSRVVLDVAHNWEW